MIKPEFSYYSNGQIKSEQYFLNGKYHRENGPAFIFYYKNGKISYEYYYLNNKCHRENGPAYISYYRDGKIEREDYYLNNVFFTKSNSETFQQDLKKYHSMVKLKSFW